MARNTDEETGMTNTNRRRFVKAIGALGVTGLAGCGGDGDTPTDTPTDTEGNGDDTPTDTEGETPTDTESPTPTDTESTPTGTPTENFGENPNELLSLSGTVAEAGSTVTLEGTLSNPYLFDLHTVTVSVTAPGDDWTVSSTGDTEFDVIDVSGSQDVAWEVTVPEDASGEYTLSFNVTYESATDQADVTAERSITAFTPGEAPTEGLIAHFPLEGSPPANAVGDTAGTITGDPVTDAEGIIGSAYEFDGEDDFVDLPEFGSDASSVSVSMWVNTENWTGGPTQLLFWGGPIPNHTGFELWMPQGASTPEFFYWNGEEVTLIAGAESAPPTGEWVHLCAVYDNDAGSGTMYINGEEAGSTSIDLDVTLDPVDTRIAAHPQEEPGIRFFAGRLDEVRFYDRPLTQGEVASIAGN